MNLLLENLVLYEVILLFLGIFLFLILSGGLVYYIVKKEEVKKLLAFFIIPIIMIAYPSIREIQFGETKLVMNTKTEEVLKNPKDSIAKKELRMATIKVESRAKTVKDFTAISNSYLALGEHDKAIIYADKALKLNKKEVEVKVGKPIKPVTNKDKKATFQGYTVKLENIKVIAKLEKEIKKDPSLLKDSIRLNGYLTQVNKTDKSKNYKYFKQRIKKSATVNNVIINGN